MKEALLEVLLCLHDFLIQHFFFGFSVLKKSNIIPSENYYKVSRHDLCYNNNNNVNGTVLLCSWVKRSLEIISKNFENLILKF